MERNMLNTKTYMAFSWMSSNYDFTTKLSLSEYEKTNGMYNLDIENFKNIYSNLHENHVFTNNDCIDNIEIFRLFHGGSPLIIINGIVRMDDMSFVLSLEDLLQMFMLDFEQKIKPYIKLVLNESNTKSMYIMHFALVDHNKHQFFISKNYDIEKINIKKSNNENISVFNLHNKFITNHKTYISECIPSISYINGKIENMTIQDIMKRLN